MSSKEKSIGKIPNLLFNNPKIDWKTAKFGSLVSFKTTNSYSRDNLNYELGVVKNIHYGDIHTKFQTLFDITNEDVPYINKEINIDKISAENYCLEGDMIFADASEDLNDVGKSIEIFELNNEKILSGLHTILARPNKGIFHKGFLGYAFKSENVRNQIKKESQGSKVLSINAGRLSKIEINYPDIVEQKKIADFFLLIDKKIQTQKKTIRHYESLLKISREKVLLKIISKKYVQLKDVARIYDGTHQTPHYVKHGIPFFSVENLTANNFVDTKFIDINVFNEENKRVKIERGDILMTRIGDIGTVKFIDWEVNASFYVSLALVKNNEKISSEYLAHFLKSNQFQKELWKRTIHVAFPKKINLGEIGECIILLPNIEEQNKISFLLTSMERKIETEKRILELLEQQKKYFLQNLFV